MMRIDRWDQSIAFRGNSSVCASPARWLRDHTVSWERKSLGCTTGTSPRRSSGSTRGDRTTAGRLALVAISWPLSPFAALPRTAVARGKSFRPTACRTCRQEKQTTKKTKIHPLPRNTHGGHFYMARKTGHFYFCVDTRSSLSSIPPVKRPYRHVGIRPLAGHGTPWLHSMIPRHCDTRNFVSGRP